MAGENILNQELVLNLEDSKTTSANISVQKEETKITSVQINDAREQYRKAAQRASILYFVLNDLHKINPMYQFSLKAFTVVFKDAIAKAEVAEELFVRINNLVESITYQVFMYTSRGLFEKDKLIFMSQMAIQILLHAKQISPNELDFLLRFPYTPNLTSPHEFLTHTSWGGLVALASYPEFGGLDKDIESSPNRWRKFSEIEAPEAEKLPGEWKNRTLLQRLCILRCLRPDRMVS